MNRDYRTGWDDGERMGFAKGLFLGFLLGMLAGIGLMLIPAPDAPPEVHRLGYVQHTLPHAAAETTVDKGGDPA